MNMRILLFLEPVIYQLDPGALKAHFPWIESFRRVAESLGGRFCLVANRETCRSWQQQETPGLEVELFELDSFSILASFPNKTAYSQALYTADPPTIPLLDKLRDIRERFSPDIVLTTAQNAYAVKAFSGIAMLHVEQPPLPRLGHPFRTGFDPCGHQSGSFMEIFRERIMTLDLPGRVARGAADLLEMVKQSRRDLHPLAVEGCDALARLAGGDKIALLATQPTDAVTFEGAYKQIEMHDLLFDWAERLPPGWIGVPTYHAGQRLSAELEEALALSSRRIRLLPRTLSCGLSEALITQADGLVTISSTSAMAALLFGKQAVVVGRSPLTSWCVNRPEEIASMRPLKQAEAARCLAVLTHRYSLRHDAIMADPAMMEPYMTQAQAGNAAQWYLDLADWSPDRALALFADVSRIPTQSHANASGNIRMQTAELEEIRSQWQQTIAQRDDLERKIVEIGVDRERIDLERARAAEYGKVLEVELNSAVADRDRIDADLMHALARCDSLAENLAMAIADRDRTDADLMHALARRDSLAENLAMAIADRDRTDADFMHALARCDSLAENLAMAIADRDRTDADLMHALARCDSLAENLATAVADRDRTDADLMHALARCDSLAENLAMAIAERDGLRTERAALQSRLNAVGAFWTSTGLRRLAARLLGFVAPKVIQTTSDRTDS